MTVIDNNNPKRGRRFGQKSQRKLVLPSLKSSTKPEYYGEVDARNNCYSRIDNQLLEALAGYGFSSGELETVLVIARKTYGFRANKTTGAHEQKLIDWISLSQFEEATGADGRRISRNRKNLVKDDVLIQVNIILPYLRGIKTHQSVKAHYAINHWKYWRKYRNGSKEDFIGKFKEVEAFSGMQTSLQDNFYQDVLDKCIELILERKNEAAYPIEAEIVNLNKRFSYDEIEKNESDWVEQLQIRKAEESKKPFYVDRPLNKRQRLGKEIIQNIGQTYDGTGLEPEDEFEGCGIDADQEYDEAEFI